MQPKSSQHSSVDITTQGIAAEYKLNQATVTRNIFDRDSLCVSFSFHNQLSVVIALIITMKYGQLCLTFKETSIY